MRPFSEMADDELGAALSAIRPEPTPTFAAELDQRVAAGFPRRSAPTPRSRLPRVLAWLRNGSRWRMLVPAGVVAITAVVVATVVVSATGRGSGGSSAMTSAAAQRHPSVIEVGGASAGEKPASTESAGGGGTSKAAQEVLKPSAEAKPTPPPIAKVGESCARGTAGCNANGEFDGSFFGNEASAGASHRDVERAADIVIGTKPNEVREASSKVFETVHRHDGIVLESATQNGSGANAEASFELLIPSGKVGDAMAAFSRIGEVVNRHESTNDITAPTVGTSERLQDSEARIEGLLAQLSESTSESEREVVESELDSERRHAARLKSHLSGLHQRANLSRVSVRIVSGKGALTPGGSDHNGDWGIGSALDDAGHLLSVAAGVTIVGFAVLAPLLVLALLAWLAGRRARERTLT
jgi:hypothetical protein